MIRRIALLLLSLPLVAAPGRPGRAADSPPDPGLRVRQPSPETLTLTLSTPDYGLRPIQIEGESYDRVSVPGYELSAEPGAPELPVASALVGVPPGAEVRLRILSDDSHPLPGRFTLPPAPQPAPIQDDLQPGAVAYDRNAGASARPQTYPVAPALLGEPAWLRDQRVVRVSLYPFQYDPSRGALTWHRELEVEISFERRKAAGSGDPADARVDADPGPFDPLLRQALVNYEQARGWRGSPEIKASQPPGSHLTSPAYKIVVDLDGVYTLTYDDLGAAGMDVDAVDPATFHLTSQGQDVAIYVEGEGDGRFDPGDAVFFYGQRFRGDRLAALYAQEMADWLWLCPSNCELAGMLEKYTEENVYWLTAGGAPGPRMGAVDGDPAGRDDPIPTSYPTTVHAEGSEIWYTHHFTSEETWFWERIRPGTSSVTRTYTTTLTALATEAYSATVRGEVVSRGENDGHHTRFTLNDGADPLDEALWDGKAAYRFEAQVPGSQLGEGLNRLHFAILYNGAIEDMYFDWFEIDYRRQFEAQGDQLAFPGDPSGPRRYRVENLASGAVRVFDLADPANPTRVLFPDVVGGGSAYTATFWAPASAGAAYLVAGESALRSPASITYVEPLDLDTAGVEYVFITPQTFSSAVQTLADYRAAQGLTTMVVPQGALYDQFLYGIDHPLAVRNFLAFTFSDWDTPPTYVTLVGGGHWNLKGYGDYGADPILTPPNLAFVDPWQGEVDSANLLATVVGDDFLPDLAIGRLPVNTLSEFETVRDKIIAYEAQTFPGWGRRAVFVVDNTPDEAGDFVALTEAVIDGTVAPSYLQAERIYLDDYVDPVPDECDQTNPPDPDRTCPAINRAITQTLNAPGALTLNFTGHASVQRWAHERILINADVPTLTNGDRLTVVLSMTCLDGYWIHPDLPDLVSALLAHPSGGAVSAFSPTGLGVSTGHDLLHEGFYAAALEGGVWDLGLASVAAKLNLFTNSGFNHDLIHTFTVFGDPALHLHNPYGLTLSPATGAQTAEAGQVVTYQLVVTNPGLEPDTYEVDLGGNAWATAVDPDPIGPLAPGESAGLEVTVTIPSDGSGADILGVTVTSRGDRSLRGTATLTTLVPVGEIALPLLMGP
jgi:hypothetical protein